MLLEIIQKFNWVDILLIVIALRACFIGLKRGFINEVFHLLAVAAALFAVFHYYPAGARFLEDKIFFKMSIAKALAYAGIWIAVALIAKFVRDGVNMLMKIEVTSLVDKLGGLIVACGRAALVASLVLCLFLVTGIDYLTRHTRRSVLAPHVLMLTPRLYRSFYLQVVSKYFPREKINPDVGESPSIEFLTDETPQERKK